MRWRILFSIDPLRHQIIAIQGDQAAFPLIARRVGLNIFVYFQMASTG
jgi:hypothetical protein